MLSGGASGIFGVAGAGVGTGLYLYVHYRVVDFERFVLEVPFGDTTFSGFNRGPELLLFCLFPLALFVYVLYFLPLFRLRAAARGIQIPTREGRGSSSRLKQAQKREVRRSRPLVHTIVSFEDMCVDMYSSVGKYTLCKLYVAPPKLARQLLR